MIQNSKGEWAAIVKRLYSRHNFGNYEKSVEAISKLGYTDFYKDATIVDAYPGIGVFSAALYNALKPKKHILLEPFPNYHKYLSTWNAPGLILDKSDPFRWATFSGLEKSGVIDVDVQPRVQVHDKLLFYTTLTHLQGLQLMIQYINCIFNQSWLQKYGRVRILAWVRVSSAERLLSGPNELFRHRQAVNRESCCDARLVIHNRVDSPPSQSGSYPKLLTNPLVLSSQNDIVSPRTKEPICLVEFTPKAEPVEYPDEFEYVIKALFTARSTPLKQNMSLLGAGAEQDLAPEIEDLLHKKPVELTLDETKRVVRAFARWPFKPEILHDFYEDESFTVTTAKV